jgi:uncharacterized protein (TIGR03435 family)
LAATVALIAAAIPIVAAQQTAFSPLTTVSIRRNVSDSPNANMQVRPGGRLFATNVSLRNMLRNIERLQESQLVGGPDWVATDRWDIVAVADTEVSEAQAVTLLKALLIERFKLKTHTETRDSPIYLLVLARADQVLGPELQRSTVDCPTAQGLCGDSSGPGTMRVVGRPIPNTLRMFERASGRTVIDRTGLTGAYDFTLRWRPFDAPDVNPDLPSLFTAVEEQLGLRLQPDRAPMDVLVIDSAQRPVEN